MGIMNSIEKVKEFHQVFGHPIKAKPSIDNVSVNTLRCDLLIEEVDELVQALKDGDQIETLDALVDIQYVLDGAFLSLGFAHLKDAAFDEVHRSNMSKLDEKGNPIYRGDGKILKGANYSPPNLAGVIDNGKE